IAEGQGTGHVRADEVALDDEVRDPLLVGGFPVEPLEKNSSSANPRDEVPRPRSGPADRSLPDVCDRNPPEATRIATQSDRAGDIRTDIVPFDQKAGAGGGALDQQANLRTPVR